MLCLCIFSVNQFVACVVISDAEFDQDNLWQDSNDVTPFTDRLVFVPNSADTPPVHGEEMLTETLLQDMIEACGDANPIIVVYSHYIPCSHIENTPYECAVRLPDWLETYRYENGGRATNMLVGYNIKFALTNEQRSLWYMLAGGIPVFKLNGETFERVLIYRTPNMNQDTVQQRMYECLTGMHMKKDGRGRLSLVDRDALQCVAGRRVEFIFSYFINYMMHQCAMSKHLYGDDNRDVLRRCMHTHITTRVNSACPEVGGDYWRPEAANCNNAKMVWVCARWAANTARFFGRPTTQHPISPVGLCNNWQADGNLAVDGSGVMQSLPRTTWDDRVPNRNLLRCEHDSGFDAALLCSDPNYNRRWTEIPYEGRDQCSTLH